MVGQDHDNQDQTLTSIASSDSILPIDFPGGTAFHPYRSLLDYFPLLRLSAGGSSRTNPLFEASDVRQAECSAQSSRRISTPDLGPLRLATLSRTLDPVGRLCQYEVPGGGQCRDATCPDVHLGQLLPQEPSGASAAPWRPCRADALLLHGFCAPCPGNSVC